MLPPLAEYPFGTKTLVVAHRGSSGTAPENTMVAFRAAIDAGARMVEIDVQRTADGRVIVFHDHVLGRTSNGSGRVDAHTYDQIRDLDAGSWMGEAFAGERIPLLIDALAYLKGRAYLNVELKRYDTTDDPDILLAAVLRTIDVADMAAHTLVSSFDHELIGRAASINPRIPGAVIMHPTDRAMPSERALPVGARAVVMSKAQLSHDRVRDARAHGLPLAVYTINTSEEALRAVRYGADVLVTNFPADIMAAVAPSHIEQ